MDSLETNETTALEQPSEITNEQQVEPAAEVAAPEVEETTPAVEVAETVAPEAEETAQEVEVTEAEQHTIEQTFRTKDEVVARVKEIAQSGEAGDRAELNLLKQLFYKFHNAEVQEAFKAFVEAGGEEDKFMPELDQAEPAFREAMQTIRERRAAIQETLEKQKQDNLKRKLEILERIQQLASTPEEANQNFDEFKALQTEWKEIKAVPAERATELWKNYQLYIEQYYDLLKLGHELRDYDFKKNLETKMRLIQQAEALAENPDVLQAFNQLQTLHQEWKETGPVAKEIREDVWAKFKEASTIINKKHQAYFDAIKAREEENLAKKTALCEQLEAFETDGLKTFADWDGITQKIKDLQAEWKTIGFAPQKMNTAIFERFRQGCDAFFEKKNAFFKNLKEELNANLAKMKELVEKAEALTDSTEGRSTGDALINLQRQWKEIGTVPRKDSEDLWKRFTAACDHFFEAKSAATAEERGEQKENLQKKQDIIDRLKALVENAAEATAQKVRDLQAEWNAVGHVPIRDKERMYRQYHDVIDNLYKQLNMGRAEQRLNSFKTTLKVTAEAGSSTLSRERERLSRAYEIMKSELQTYENNIGFLTASSKKGNSLVAEIQKKVDKLKDELNLLREKIKAVEQEMHKQTQQ